MPEVGLTTTANDLHVEAEHVSYIFPSATNLTCTFTAGGVANTYGAWTEIQDSGATTLSSVFATDYGHISAIVIEDADTNDKAYMFELSYGAAKTLLDEYRFIAGSVKLPAVQQVRYRTLRIPVGETLYYRMMCETADATCDVHFRYHYH